jgi:hypothetical protein
MHPRRTDMVSSAYGFVRLKLWYRIPGNNVHGSQLKFIPEKLLRGPKAIKILVGDPPR